jgi:signal recognition particle subunit SRP54
MAQRILGMGDIVGLVSEAMEKFDAEETAKLQAKMEKGQFTLEDFMTQMGQVKKLGPMGKVMGMIPGMSEMSKQMNMGEGEVEKQMGRMRAIYDSMNKKERQEPRLPRRPAPPPHRTGAGVAPTRSGQFMKQFEMTRDMMRAVGGMGMMGRLKMMKALAGGGLSNLGMPGGPMLKTKKSGWQGAEGPEQKEAAVATLEWIGGRDDHYLRGA